MLVIAPLRVMRNAWPREIAKWSQFDGLKYVVLHGDKKEALLRKADADIYLINPEGVPWLCKMYFARPLPFDVLVIDELTKFKDARKGSRGSILRAQLHRGPRYRWGLTGSLAGDGNYEDVFGQQLMLDDGAALGRFITHYRDRYFSRGYDGFSWLLNRGAEHEILGKLAPTWFYMDPKDYAQLPPLVDVPHILEMNIHERRLYTKMQNDYLATLPGGVIEAANAGAAYMKLAQLANGAVYDENRDVHFIHNIKLDALEELVEELNGEPLLVAYEFQHDLARLKERFPTMEFLGGGQSEAKEADIIRRWNKGEISLLGGHPAGMGHGLNLQEANACNICWFSMVWSHELFEQLTGRLKRDGNAAAQIFNHMLIVRGTIDEDKLATRDQKAFTSANLIRVLNMQILRETREAHGAGGSGPTMETDQMVARLSQPAPPAAPPAQAPAGWGAPTQAQPAVDMRQHQPTPQAPAGWGPPAAQGAPADQRDRIQSVIAPPAAQPSPGFNGGVQSMANGVATGDYGPTANAGVQPAPAGWGAPAAQGAPFDGGHTVGQGAPAAAPAAPRARRSRAAAPEQAPPATAAEMTPEQNDAVAAVLTARCELLKIAFADATTPLDEGLSVADVLWKWVNAF